MHMRRIEFDNKSVIFLRPEDHDFQIQELLHMVQAKQITIHDMTLETAAAWQKAMNLFYLPIGGNA